MCLNIKYQLWAIDNVNNELGNPARSFMATVSMTIDSSAVISKGNTPNRFIVSSIICSI